MSLILSISISVVLLIVWFRWFFDDFSDFLGHLKFLFIPNWLSATRGEFDDDRMSTLKVFLYFALSIGPGVLTYFSIR